MSPATEQRIAAARSRLQYSRAEMFGLMHALKGDEPRPQEQSEGSGGFPHSRILRTLLGGRGRMLLGAAALTLTLTQPKLIWRALKFAPLLRPLLRPLLTRYLLPKLLGQR